MSRRLPDRFASNVSCVSCVMVFIRSRNQSAQSFVIDGVLLTLPSALKIGRPDVQCPVTASVWGLDQFWPYMLALYSSCRRFRFGKPSGCSWMLSVLPCEANTSQVASV